MMMMMIIYIIFKNLTSASIYIVHCEVDLKLDTKNKNTYSKVAEVNWEM